MGESAQGRKGEWTLPDGWVWTTLGEVIEPSSEKANPLEIQRTPYIGLEHIESDTGKLLGLGYSDETRSTKAVFCRGDLLYGKLRPYLNKVHVVDFDGVCSTDILVFRDSPNASNRFLLYRLLCGDFVRYANLNVSGVQHPRTHFNVLAQFPLALPPLPEQRRIVAEIETQFTRLDAAVAALERVQANIRRYKAAVLQAACEGRLVPTEAELAGVGAHRDAPLPYEPAGQLLARILAERRARWEAENPSKKYKEPAPPDAENLPELPEGWMWISLEQATILSQNGLSKRRSEEGCPTIVLRLADIDSGERISLEDVRRIRLKEAEIEKYQLLANDILCIRVNGSPDLVGRVIPFVGANESIAFCDHFIRFRLAFRELAGFLTMCFHTERIRKYVDLNKVSSAGQNTVSQGTMTAIALPLPPLPEQHRIVAEVERRLSVVAALEASVEAALARAGRLRQAVLKQAFEGRLVPQDPDDEPASALLQRIRAEKAQRETERKPKGKGSGRKRRETEKA